MSALSYLVELEPVVARLLDRHLATAKEWFPHDYVPWDQARNFGDAPWQSSDSPLDEIYVFLVALLSNDSSRATYNP